MSAQRYYVIGGEYADTSFTVPAPGTQLETRGPFVEREAKVCWRELTGKTVDNAMVRYFLKSEDELAGKNYWVVGGEYADFSFTQLASGKELEVHGPFEKWQAAHGFWRGMTAKSVDDALVRYDIRENYHPGDGIPSRRIGPARPSIPPTVVKSVTIAAPTEKVFAFLMDGGNWPRWAIHNVKAVRPGKSGVWEMETSRGPGSLTLKGDPTSGVIDHTFAYGNGVAWTVPGRVVAVSGGAVYMSVFSKPTELSEAQFALGMELLDEELAALKRVLENA